MLVCLLVSCSNESEENKKHISSTVFETLSPAYKGKNISDYRVIAALVQTETSLEGFAYEPKKPDSTLVAEGEYVLSLYFAKKGGLDISEYGIDIYTAKLADALKNSDSLSAYEVFLCVSSLNLLNIEFDRKAVADSLARRQNGVSGGFYDYIQTSGTSVCNTEASAYAYMCYVILREQVDDLNLDNAILYLGNSINNDNTISGANGKTSCKATALGLTAMLASGIPSNGEISTALFTAMEEFKFGIGYTDTVGGNTASDDVNASVLLCAATALKGNPFTVKN